MVDMMVDVGTVLAPWQVVSCVYECVLLVTGLLLCYHSYSYQHSILRTLPYVGPQNEGTGLESFGNLLGVSYPIVVMSGSKPSDPRP